MSVKVPNGSNNQDDEQCDNGLDNVDMHFYSSDKEDECHMQWETDSQTGRHANEQVEKEDQFMDDDNGLLFYN